MTTTNCGSVSEHQAVGLAFSLTRVEEVVLSRERRDLAVALYTGIVLAILVYNIFLAFSTGQSAYFSYTLVVVTVGLVQWGFNGYDRLLWGHIPWMARNGLTVSGAASGLAALIFARDFEVRRYTPKWNRLIQGLLAVYGAALASALLGRPMLAYNLVNLGALSAPAMLVMSLVSWRRGNSTALWFFVAWGIFIAAVTAQALRDFGALPNTQTTALFLPLGTVLQMLLLSFALGDRINLLKRSSDMANAGPGRFVGERAHRQGAERRIGSAGAAKDGGPRYGQQRFVQHPRRAQGRPGPIDSDRKVGLVGQMTAGIAHELNNPINYVQSNATSLRRDIEELIEVVEAFSDAAEAIAEGTQGGAQLAQAARDKARHYDLDFLKEESRQLIAGILEGAERTSRIVGGLRVFGRMDGDQLVEASLADLLEASITVLGNRARTRANIDGIPAGRAGFVLPERQAEPGFHEHHRQRRPSDRKPWDDVEQREVRVWNWTG